MDRIAVLIPCYNESKTIEKVVTDYKKVLPDATIYVYDNNSTDNTGEIAEKAGAIVCQEYQQGNRDVSGRCFCPSCGGYHRSLMGNESVSWNHQ